ncbi:MAG TPA: LysR family transcriptional regulator [Blastocatellia bacterium]|nr:LysR family transcriptional regulator [Blastocatellia bacterium]
MELRALKSLDTLAATGSITRTAQKLNLSPAAVHKQLKVLEDELGVQLYEKSGRQLRLTQAAITLLPYVKNLLAQYDATLLALNEWKGSKHGLIKVGTGPATSSYILPFFLGKFRRKFPNVELSVETGAASYTVECLRTGSLDLIFLVSGDDFYDPDFRVEASWDFEMVLVSAQQRGVRPCSLSELQEHPFIFYKEGSVFDRLIERYFMEADFHPRVIMRLDNTEAIKAMIRLRLGISMLPMWTLKAELKDRTLSLIQQKEPPLFAKISLVTRRHIYRSKPLEGFVKLAQHWHWKEVYMTNRQRRLSADIR